MLVIALIIITTVAVVTAAVLTHGFTNFRATVALRGVAGTSYAADAAGKIAVNNLRLGATAPGATAPGATYPSNDWVYSNNVDGTGCFGLEGSAPKNSLVLSNVYPKAGGQTADSSARVECSVVPGTGLFGGGGGTDVSNDYNGFKRAITTFAGPITVTDNSVMQIRGGIASATSVNVAGNAGLYTNGYVWANGACGPGIITSTPAKDCSHGAFDLPQVSEPLTQAAVEAMTYRRQAVGDCSFLPGYYNDASWLETRTNACAPAHFAPGTYYFDFNNDATDVTHNDLVTGDNVWNINRLVIAGTRSPGNPTAVPGTCVSPIENPFANGVRFVFGSNSGVHIDKNGIVELCGSYSATEAPVALQQAMSGSAPVKLTTTSVATGPVVTAGSNPAFTGNPVAGDLSAPGGGAALWKAPSNGNPKAALKLTGLNPTPSIPAGSMLKKATLTVTHREVQSAAGPTLRPLNVLVTAGASTYSRDLPIRPVMSTEPMPDPNDDLTKLLDDAVRAGTLSTVLPTIDLTVSGAKSMDLTVDAVELKLEYYPPTLRPAVEADFLTQETESYQGSFVVQGAAYAPKGLIQFTLGNQQDVAAFRYGIAAREVRIDGHPQVPYGYPLVSIPEQGAGLGRRVTVVDLKVHVCVSSAACSSGGTHALTARVMITDPPWPLGGKPSPGKRRIDILSWAEQN